MIVDFRNLHLKHEPTDPSLSLEARVNVEISTANNESFTLSQPVHLYNRTNQGKILGARAVEGGKITGVSNLGAVFINKGLNRGNIGSVFPSTKRDVTILVSITKYLPWDSAARERFNALTLCMAFAMVDGTERTIVVDAELGRLVISATAGKIWMAPKL